MYYDSAIFDNKRKLKDILYFLVNSSTACMINYVDVKGSFKFWTGTSMWTQTIVLLFFTPTRAGCESTLLRDFDDFVLVEDQSITLH